MTSTKKTARSAKDGKYRLPSKRLLPELDLDVEMARHNVAIAELLILTGLIKGDPNEQRKIMSLVTSIFFAPKLFPQFLFERIVAYLQVERPHRITVEWVTSQIEPYYKVIWDSTPRKRELQGKLFTCAQIFDFNPTPEQVLRSIELRKMVAESEGLISDDEH